MGETLFDLASSLIEQGLEINEQSIKSWMFGNQAEYVHTSIEAERRVKLGEQMFRQYYNVEPYTR